MARRFDYWVVLGGMRTGSNLLEEYLGAMPGIESHGELFNPHFFGKPGEKTRFGLSMAARDADPVRTVGAMRTNASGLPGFRLFYDHDPRVIRHVLDDPQAAKIVLTRRPIDSYVSLKIARKTDQWWLGDMKTAKVARVPFDADEYVSFLNTLAAFQGEIAYRLQVTGQTAFHIAYDDLSDPDVIAGLGKYLGADGPPDPARVRAKVQNPTPVRDRLTNPADAEEALLSIAAPDIGRVPVHEPERGPALKMFRVCKSAPLLYMPIRGAGFDPIPDWLKAVDPEGKVESGLTQRDMRRWKRQHPGHRGFSVVRHPLERVHDSFCRFILPAGEESYADVRAGLTGRYEVPLPPDGPGDGWTLERHRAAFLAFLEFLKGNLGGQTSLRVDNTWATQDMLLSAIGQFAIPDRVIREDSLAESLGWIASEAGVSAPPLEGGFAVPAPFPLAEVVTDDIHAAAEAAYRRDYLMFGYRRWAPDQAA